MSAVSFIKVSQAFEPQKSTKKSTQEDIAQKSAQKSTQKRAQVDIAQKSAQKSTQSKKNYSKQFSKKCSKK